jgi:ribosomal protein L37E
MKDYTKEKTCQRCGDRFAGTASSKYCMVCKFFVATKVERDYNQRRKVRI